MKERTTLTLSRESVRIMQARGGPRGRSSLVDDLLVQHDRAVRHAQGVCIAKGLSLEERELCAEGARQLANVGYCAPETVAAELYKLTTPIRRGMVTSDRWLELVQLVGKSAALASALLVLAGPHTNDWTNSFSAKVPIPPGASPDKVWNLVETKRREFAQQVKGLDRFRLHTTWRTKNGMVLINSQVCTPDVEQLIKDTNELAKGLAEVFDSKAILNAVLARYRSEDKQRIHATIQLAIEETPTSLWAKVQEAMSLDSRSSE